MFLNQENLIFVICQNAEHFEISINVPINDETHSVNAISMLHNIDLNILTVISDIHNISAERLLKDLELLRLFMVCKK